MTDYFDGWRRYFDFRGRSSSRQYWLFVLINFAVFAALMVPYTPPTQEGTFQSIVSGEPTTTGSGEVFFALALLLLLAKAIPTVAAAVRRLHDTGRSGWYLLLAAIPLANLVLLVYLIMSGDPGDNRYGAAPAGTMNRVKVPERSSGTWVFPQG